MKINKQTAEGMALIAYVLTQSDGGVTVNANFDRPTDGYVIALDGYQMDVRADMLTEQELVEYIEEHKTLLEDGFYLGVWVDNSSFPGPTYNHKTAYIDICMIAHTDQFEAILLGSINKQRTIYHVKSKQIIAVNKPV